MNTSIFAAIAAVTSLQTINTIGATHLMRRRHGVSSGEPSEDVQKPGEKEGFPIIEVVVVPLTSLVCLGLFGALLYSLS